MDAISNEIYILSSF